MSTDSAILKLLHLCLNACNYTFKKNTLIQVLIYKCGILEKLESKIIAKCTRSHTHGILDFYSHKEAFVSLYSPFHDLAMLV